MGIWIRSQNRGSLTFANDIALCDTSEYVEKSKYPFDRKYKNTQLKAFDHDYTTILGEYSTKERALQVLDEIQQYIISGTTEAHERDTDATWRKVEKYGVVYIMPES
jgi:hypothetical protein